MKIYLLMLLLVLPVVLIAANPGDVVINELMWMGTCVTTDEWIELYNTTDSDIDLTGWYILDDGGVQTYDLSGIIPAYGFFLIEKREEATDVPSDLIVSNMILGNLGDDEELFDSSGTSIDMVSCGDGWYAGLSVPG